MRQFLNQPVEVYSLLNALAGSFDPSYRLERIDADTVNARDEKWYIVVQIFGDSVVEITVSSPSHQETMFASFAKEDEHVDGDDVAADTEDRAPIETIVLWRDH